MGGYIKVSGKMESKMAEEFLDPKIHLKSLVYGAMVKKSSDELILVVILVYKLSLRRVKVQKDYSLAVLRNQKPRGLIVDLKCSYFLSFSSSTLCYGFFPASPSLLRSNTT